MKNRFRYQIPTLLILTASLGVTYKLWQHEQHNIAIDQQKSFDFNLREAIGSIEQRMAAYEQVLRGTQGLYAASDVVEREEFQVYINALKLGANYSGIQGVGIIPIVAQAQKEAHIAAMRKQGFPSYAIKPESHQDVYAPVIQFEPSVGRNLLMLGLDHYAVPSRRNAMEQARDSGSPAITGKVTLLVDAKSDAQPGFVMFLPMFKKGTRSDTIAARRANINGWVIATFRMKNLMAGLYSRRVSMADITIYDGVEMTPQTLLYDSQAPDGKLRSIAHKDKKFIEATEYIEVGGRTWTLAIRSLPEFDVLQGKDNSRLIAIAGIGLSLLLTMLSWALLSGRARAMSLAQKMTQELRESEARFRHQAQHDSLTGLPNRALFSDRLGQALAQAKRQHKRLALMFIDLDAFKPINDKLGHHVGDFLLKEVALRMQQHMRASDTVARIGGDEFVVLLPSIEDAQDALVLADIIRNAISEPFEMPDGTILNISSSIGVAVYPEDGLDETQLSRNADSAMYYAKQSGRNTVQAFQAQVTF
ncbi:MAG: diguanylate cyclase [Glaciimonas sp.]|nr:diguanylate cyclase [Glaciimonas sp.]